MDNLPIIDEITYDGIDLPIIINEILQEENVIFGGSSLIHDIYFKEEDWGERDYDLWCTEHSYFKIQRKLRINEKCKKIKEETYNSKYSHLRINSLCEYSYKNDDETKLKIQLINVGRNFKYMIKNLDFSFVSLIYDGTNLKFIFTTEQEIKEKKGCILIPNNNGINTCSCGMCMRNNDISQKTILRIKKYQKRGFTFLNLCTFCKNYEILSFEHFNKCKCKKIEETKKNEEISTLASTTTNPELIICCLNFYAKNRLMEDFINLFNHKKELIQFHSQNFKKLLQFCADNGQYTFFKLLMEFWNTQLNYLIEEIFLNCGRKNYINICRYLSNKYPKLYINIFEDKITEYKILSIFEYYLEYNDANILTTEMPQIKFIEGKTNEDGSEAICPICKCFSSNIELSCGHDFCDKCIITYFANQHNKGTKLKCGVCRLNL